MNEVMEKETNHVENMIYEINGVEVMLDVELSVSECHCYLYDKIVPFL